MVVSTKMAVMWVVVMHPDDSVSKDLWNTGKLIPVYMVIEPRRQPSKIFIVDCVNTC
jgi:hypothetical protein